MTSGTDGATRPTPAWLTAALRRSGVLPQGHVVAVAAQPNAAFNSYVSHLALTYSPDAPAGAPTRLLLKRSRPEAWARAAGEREAAFYTAVATERDHPPMIVPCYAAGYEAADDAWYVLLRDLTATHRPALSRDQQLTPGENVPSEVDVARVVDALAQLHGYWWEHADLGPGGGAVAAPWSHFRDAAGFSQFVERAAASWATLVRDHGDRLPAGVRATVDWAVLRLPRLWDRHLAARVPARAGVTLTHGDAYFANFLCPRTDPAPAVGRPAVGRPAGSQQAIGHGAAARTYLIDWQGPAVQIGAEDLANLCATFWTPAQRAAGQRELRILRRYHAGLDAAGVRDYPWAQLLTDYRGAVISWLTVPLQDATEGAGPDYWLPKLCCLAGAFEDLGCAGLLGP